jgi:hypothetical protein
MIIACKAAPARCSVAAIVASRSPSAVNTSIASLSMRRSRSARSRPQGGKPSYAEDRRIIRAIRDRQTPRTPDRAGLMRHRSWLSAAKTDSWLASCTAPRRTG